MINSSRILPRFLNDFITPFASLRKVNTLQMRKQVPVLILSPTYKDYKAITNFMKEHYFPHEPTCKALGIKNNTILLDRMILTLTQGLSLIAKNKTSGDILGVSLNEKTTSWDADLCERLACTIQCQNLKKLLQFYAMLERAPNIFDKFEVSEVFEIANIAVAKEYQSLGIANKLMLKSKGVAKKRGFKILRVDATSFYSAKICERMKMQLVHEIPYKSYLDANRKPVFDIPLPHTSVKVYVMELLKKKGSLTYTN